MASSEFDKHKDQILKVLKEKGALTPCSRCGHDSLTFINGYFNALIQDQANTLKDTGRGMPYICLLCNNCGFIIQHSLGILKLMPGKAKNVSVQKKSRAPKKKVAKAKKVAKTVRKKK